MNKIDINQIRQFPDGIFQVTVSGEQEENKTIHIVNLEENYYKKLTNEEISPEALVTRSFEFLLAREPKESILKEFELSEIQKYFPEYEKEMKNLLPLIKN